MGAVMEAAVPDNGSQLQSVSFDVSDKTAAYTAALGDGAAKAKSKAEAMAARRWRDAGRGSNPYRFRQL